MTRVLAAIDNSLAARPVLATARALALLFGAEVEAVHVQEDGARVATSEAAAAGVDLELLAGPTVERLAAAAAGEGVTALVIGSRGTAAGARPVGTTAFELVTSVQAPLVVVPPDVARPGELRRVLVPLEGTVSSALAPRRLIELARDAALEVAVLHVHDDASLPSFTDQPQHEAPAWAEEFVERNVPGTLGDVRFEARVGRREDEILRAADAVGADLIAVGWSQDLAPGRAPVVRSLLGRGSAPVLLVPVDVTSERLATVGVGAVETSGSSTS